MSLSLILLALSACAPSTPLFDPGLTPVTVVPSPDRNDPAALCAAADAAWTVDWPGAIRALQALGAQNADCGDGQSIAEKLYAAHYNYGRSLAAEGQTAQAVAEYEAALRLYPGEPEVMRALRDLGVFTPTPLLTCLPEDVQAMREALPAYIPSEMSGLVRVDGSRFDLNGSPYLVRGVNYYPARFPWRRFLTEAVLDDVRAELDLLRDAGFNTLRLFLWHDALFTCPGNGVVPVADAFARLDGVIQEAAARGFRLILTLNDLPDLIQYPLYGSPQHTRSQIAFLVERYRDEAAILAWDARNEGDIDYGERGDFSREEVLSWLAETSALIREHDPNHLITAGWLQDAEATAPYVDFVSFHFYGENAVLLRAQIALLRAYTARPLLMEEFGYSTFGREEVEQSRLLREAIQAAEYDGLAGWLIWTAFDFPADAACIPPACPSEDNANHHYGLWSADYSPKLALGVIEALLAQPVEN